MTQCVLPYPGEYSVVIDDAKQMEAFLDHAKPLAKKLGISLRFSDCGWLKVKDNIASSRKTSLLTTLLYLGAAAVALLLATYLYIGRQKNSYAIMRALGAPKSKAHNALGLPLAVLSAVAIPVGAAAGMAYASEAVSSVLKNLAITVKQYTPDATLPVGTMVVCLICEIVFMTLLAALFLRKLAKMPPLALLQGNANRTKTKNRTRNGTRKIAHRRAEVPAEDGIVIPAFAPPFAMALDMPEHRGYNALRQVASYILRHMRRAGYRTVITVVLAVLLTGAMGLLAVTRLSYQELFDKTKVVGVMNNYASSAVMEAQQSKHMKNFYYSGGYFVILNDTPDGWVIILHLPMMLTVM